MAPALVPRIAPKSRADEFADKEVAKGKKLRVVFDRAFKEMWETLTVSKIADMKILGEVRGIKEKVADLLGEKMMVSADTTKETSKNGETKQSVKR